jgi:hypothetical protein
MHDHQDSFVEPWVKEANEMRHECLAYSMSNLNTEVKV